MAAKSSYVIPTSGDTFNVIGVENGEFVLQGNLTLEQLEKLGKDVAEAVRIARRS